MNMINNNLTTESGTDDSRIDQIRVNVDAVRMRIARAADRAGRDPRSIKVIAVSKSVGPSETAVLWDMGMTEIAENRVQNTVRKVEAMGEMARKFKWHLIGNLQTNKIRRALDLFTTMHSMNSVTLALALESEIQTRPEMLLPIYVEINNSGEEAKSGAHEQDLKNIFHALRDCPHLMPMGLMTMGPRTGGQEASRTCFRKLREQLAELRDSGAAPKTCSGLSMGMSDDFEAAVEEGATVVRIGRAFFQ